MKSNIFRLISISALLFLTLSQFSLANSDPGFNCYQYTKANEQFYNLYSITPNSDQTASISNTHVGKSGTVTWNVCDIPKQNEACPKDLNNVGFIITNDGKCFALSQETATQKTLWTSAVLKEATMSLTSIVGGLKEMTKKFILFRGAAMTAEDDEDKVTAQKEKMIQRIENVSLAGNGKDGISMNGNNKEIYDYSVQLDLHCNAKSEKPSDQSATWDSAKKLYVLSLSHKDACGYDLNSWIDGLGAFKYVIGVVGALLGLVMAFFGLKLWKPSLAVIGFCIGAALTMLILNSIWASEDMGYKVWIMLGIAAVIGIICAFVLIYMEKLAPFAAGAFFGIVLGFQLYSLVIYKMESGNGSNLWLWITVISCAVIFAVLAMVLHDTILILATSFGGAYLCVFMVGSMIGNFPDMATIAMQIKAGQFSGMPTMAYVYIGISLALGITATIFQFCRRNEEKEEEKHKQDAYYDNLV